MGCWIESGRLDVNAGASNEAGVLPFYVSAKDQSSSFLDYSRIKNDAVRKIEVPVRTLSEIRSSLALAVPEMRKFDAEGFDLKVLQGASDFVGHTEISSPKEPLPNLTLRIRPAT